MNVKNVSEKAYWLLTNRYQNRESYFPTLLKKTEKIDWTSVADKIPFCDCTIHYIRQLDRKLVKVIHEHKLIEKWYDYFFLFSVHGDKNVRALDGDEIKVFRVEIQGKQENS